MRHVPQHDRHDEQREILQAVVVGGLAALVAAEGLRGDALLHGVDVLGGFWVGVVPAVLARVLDCQDGVPVWEICEDAVNGDGVEGIILGQGQGNF